MNKSKSKNNLQSEKEFSVFRKFHRNDIFQRNFLKNKTNIRFPFLIKMQIIFEWCLGVRNEEDSEKS